MLIVSILITVIYTIGAIATIKLDSLSNKVCTNKMQEIIPEKYHIFIDTLYGIVWPISAVFYFSKRLKGT